MQPTDPIAPAPAAQTDDRPAESIDLRAYWRTLLRRRWLVVPFFLATVAAVAIVTLRQTKIYDATCTIIIDLTAPKVLDDQQVQDVVQSGTGGYWFSKEYYETQYKVITSRAVAERALDELQLQSSDPSMSLGGVADPQQREAARNRLVAQIQKNLKVEPVKDSRIVRIRFEDTKAERAALIANAIADAYIKESLAVRTAATNSANTWLEVQLRDLDLKLKQSGKALFEFKRDHDIVATSWEDRQSMVSQRLTAINEALTKAQVRRAELEARKDAIEGMAGAIERGDPQAESLQPVAENPIVRDLKTRLQEAQSECADIKLKYLEGHPKSEACEQKVAMAKKALKSEIGTTIEAAKQEYTEVLQSERKLRALLNETKSGAFDLNQYEREYQELRRANDNNQRLYDLVLRRLKDTGVTGLLQASNVRVLDAARPKLRAIRPDLKQNLIIAIVIGLLGGVGLAFLAEMLDNTIISQEQIEERLGLTFLGIIPQIERSKDGRAQDLIIHTQPKSAVAECLRAVRTNILFMSPEKQLRMILITSSGPQEGKTTTVATLAGTMSESGHRVLILDADMRRPRVHRIYEVSNDRGLSSLILGDTDLDGTVQPTKQPNIFVVPCGPVPPNPAELLHTARFRSILAHYSQRFDRVIIDSPPIGIVADAAVIATQVDGTVLVLKAGSTTRDLAHQSVRALNDVKARVFGAVLNNLDLEDQKYGQYYYYRYGYYYGDKREKTA